MSIIWGGHSWANRSLSQAKKIWSCHALGWPQTTAWDQNGCPGKSLRNWTQVLSLPWADSPVFLVMMESSGALYSMFLLYLPWSSRSSSLVCWEHGTRRTKFRRCPWGLCPGSNQPDLAMLAIRVSLYLSPPDWPW